MERIQGRIVRAFPDRGFCIVKAESEDFFAHRSRFKDQSSIRQLLASDHWRLTKVTFAAGNKEAGKRSRPALEIEVMA